MNILNNSFSGRWVLNARRRVDKLRALIDTLFGNGEQGAMYIPKPQVLGQQVLFQDAAGTVPVVSDGDPVGLILDLSGNGNHSSQATSASRPIYLTDGTVDWLELDGVDDHLSTDSFFSDDVSFYFMVDSLTLSSGTGLLAWYDDAAPAETRTYIDDNNNSNNARLFTGGTLYIASGAFPPGLGLLGHVLSSGVWRAYLDGAEKRSANITMTGDESYVLDIFRARHSTSYKHMGGKCYGVISTGYGLINNASVNK